MKEQDLRDNNQKIVELEEEIEELREHERELVREHHAEIHDQVGHIIADHPSSRARFYFRHDHRQPVDGFLQGNGTQACWINPINPTSGALVGLATNPDHRSELKVRIDYIDVAHVVAI